MQIHFLSNVLVAVASLDLYSPNVEGSWLLQTCEGCGDVAAVAVSRGWT